MSKLRMDLNQDAWFESEISEEEAFKCFQEGLESFDEDNLTGSLAIWSKFHLGFYKSNQVIKGFRELTSKYNSANKLEAEVANFFEAAKHREINLEDLISISPQDFEPSSSLTDCFYPLYQSLFFSLDVGPSLFIEKDCLSKKRDSLLHIIKEKKESFAKYQLGVCDFYLGNINSGINLFSEIADTMPNTKSRPLRIRKISAFSRDLIYRIKKEADQEA